MEAIFEQACKDAEIPGAVLIAENTKGDFQYKHAFGVRSLDPASGDADHQPPMEANTLMWIASASKLVTSIAAMQCVERGLVGLDDDVGPFDPDLRDIKLLTGFDADGQPIYAIPKEKITIRRLLTHSAGLDYDFFSPLLRQLRTLQKLPIQSAAPTLVERYFNPLVSEPGTKWGYSSSIDWAGRIVERISGQSLEDFIQTNIAKPLGLKNMTFFPQKHPELRKNHASMTVRDPATGQVVHTDDPLWHTDPEDAMGGAGLFTTPEDYFQILLSLLRNDERLLSKDTLKEMLSPQLTPSSKAYMKEEIAREMYGIPYEQMGMGAYFPPGSERDYCLAGMYLVEDLPSGLSPRRPGTVAWVGLPHVYWFIDPASELCALFATQVKPPFDEKTRKLVGVFERAMYERLKETR